jgi:hypothetical protein
MPKNLQMIFSNQQLETICFIAIAFMLPFFLCFRVSFPRGLLLSLICGILIMPYEAVNFTAHLFWW